VGGHDQLGALTGGNRTQFTINRVLKDHMQMRIRFIQQQDGRRPCVQESQKHQNLLKPAARAGDIKPRAVGNSLVFGNNVCSGRIRGQ